MRRNEARQRVDGLGIVRDEIVGVGLGDGRVVERGG